MYSNGDDGSLEEDADASAACCLSDDGAVTPLLPPFRSVKTDPSKSLLRDWLLPKKEGRSTHRRR
jgi:hypothetical protein